jgi:hypothetical protein
MLRFRACAVAAVFGFFATLQVWAQAPAQGPPSQQPAQPEKPISPEQSQGENRTTDEPPTPPVVAGTVNNAPLTGANEPPLGIFSSRSFLVPALEFYGQLDSNGTNTPFGNFTSIDTILGAISAQKSARSSQLNLDYTLGRSFSNKGNLFNSTLSDLNTSYLWSRGRWDGFATNRLVYSSQASFFGGIAPFEFIGPGRIAGFGSSPLVLRNSFFPSQGIFTNFGPRLTDSAVVQVNNHLSRRLFFTLVGNYETLRFFDSDLVNSSSGGFQAGIGFQRTRQDAVALVYRLDNLWFSNLPVKLRENVIELAYERRLAERWRFQVAAGPDITLIHAPNEFTGATQVNSTRHSWVGDLVVMYQLRRTNFRFGYDHYITTGGGVFLGSVRDGVYATANRELSRVWTVDITMSYNHNKNLVPLPAGITGIFAPANGTYNSVYGGFEMHRRVGRDSELFFGYLARHQNANYTLCQVDTGLCLGPNVTGHQFNFGFLWRVKPIPIG